MNLEEQVPLKSLTTMRTGGSAQFVAHITSVQDIEDALKFADSKQIPTMIIGGGSNMVAPDHGFAGVVLLMKSKGITFEEKGNDVVRVVVAAGESWDTLVSETTKREFYGLENLSYIPGTVGGACVQNIGAYGSEIKDAIESVEVFDRSTFKVHVFTKDECHFGYRDSIFKHQDGKNFIVTGASFLLSKKPYQNLSYKALSDYLTQHAISEPSAIEIRNAVIAIRKEKLPEITDVGTAGSFFKNPIIDTSVADALKAQFPQLPLIPLKGGMVKVPAAWLIENIGGWKSYRKGNAGVYEKHALVLVNYKDASAKDIISIAIQIEESVFRKTGIRLEREVIVWD